MLVTAISTCPSVPLWQPPAHKWVLVINKRWDQALRSMGFLFCFLNEDKLQIGNKRECCWFSVSRSCPILCNPMDCSMWAFPVLHYLLEFAQTMSMESVMPSNHLIFCHPLLFLPSIFSSIKVFCNQLALHRGEEDKGPRCETPFLSQKKEQEQIEINWKLWARSGHKPQAQWDLPCWGR